MTPLDVLPLHYWVTTRVKGAGILASYAVLTWGILVAGVAAFGDWSWHSVAGLAVSWAGYWCIYELGYIVNDLWSQRREVRSGVYVNKPLLQIDSHLIVGVAITSRVVCFCGSVIVVHALTATTPAKLVGVTALMACVFAAHNVMIGRARLVSFFLLQLLRYALIVVVTSGQQWLWIVACLGVPPSVASTLTYGRAKGFIHWCGPEMFRTVGASLRVMALVYTMEAAFCDVIALGTIGPVCARLAAASLIAHAVYVGFRFSRAVLTAICACSVRYHVHTDASHDATWSPLELAQKAREYDLRAVYVTEHCEDLTYHGYEALKRSLTAVSVQNNLRLVPGIEYSVCGQHVLAICCDKYVNLDPDAISSIDALRGLSAELIWAHPRIALRKVFTSAGYCRQLLELSVLVDCIECLNLKADRPPVLQLRYLAAAGMAMYLGHRCQVVVGLDAHCRSTWSSAEQRLQRLRTSRLVVALARLCVRQSVSASSGATGLRKESRTVVCRRGWRQLFY